MRRGRGFRGVQDRSVGTGGRGLVMPEAAAPEAPPPDSKAVTRVPRLSSSRVSRDAGASHGFDRQNPIELRGLDQAPFENDLANRLSCRNGFLGDLGGLLVSQIRTERRRERGTAFEQFASARFVSGDA